MKNWFIAGIAALSTIAACSTDEKMAFTNYDEKSSVSRISNATRVPDAMAAINRRPDRLDFIFHSYGKPRAAYTVWLCGFNKPSECMDTPCSLDELKMGIGDSFCQWGGGAIADEESGSLTIRGRSDVTSQVVLGDGLVNFSGAEIHLILRNHGTGLAEDQLWQALTSFEGGCPPNTCTDEQTAVFSAT